MSPKSVVSSLKVTLPEALVLFFNVKVLEAPVTVPSKVMLPLVLFTVALAVKTVGPLKLILPVSEVTLAPSSM